MLKKILHHTLLISLALSFLVLSRSKAPLPPTIAKPRDFSALKGWEKSTMLPSFQAFKASCESFLKQNPEKRVGSSLIALKIKDWQPACQSALQFEKVTEQTAHHFFQTWFTPVAFYKNKPLQGTFTGYYMPTIPGRLKKAPGYTTPIYGTPKDLVHISGQGRRQISKRLVGGRLLPYHTRREIDQGAILNKAPIIAWVKSPVDRLFLEIEGSGSIELDNGQTISVTYATENGAHYTSIASILIRQGLLSKHTASYANIKRYLESHPHQMMSLMAQNQSFVFFEKLDAQYAMGAQGTPLTSGYSLAVDRNYIPLGTPMWLHTQAPVVANHTSLDRLMIAQDTGGAIKGIIRGDIFLGHGPVAEKTAAHIKHPGRYWMLLPRHIASKINSSVLKKSRFLG